MTQETEREAFTYSPQDGENGHCFAAQVWDANGKNVAIVDGANAEEATQRARIIADALNNAARARVVKGDDMYTNSPVSIPIAETCIQSDQAKPVEVGGLFDVMNKVIYNLREGECWRKECAQAILARYNVSEKGE